MSDTVKVRRAKDQKQRVSTMGRSRSYCYGEVLPFMIMIFLQFSQVGVITFFKAASTEGMSPLVFQVYIYLLSCVVLLPLSLIFDRKKNLPRLNLKIVGRFFLLGSIGVSAQQLGFSGIKYSSPTLASALSNLTPAFTFVLAILFRMEKLEIKSLTSQAKVLGTVLSIGGAMVMVLYEGPIVVRTLRYPPLSAPQSNWIIGGILLFVDYILLSLWYVVQAQTVMIYPSELLVVFANYFTAGLIAAPITYFSEKDINAWKINSPTKLYAVLYSGLLGSSSSNVILTWCLHFKGPVYVTLYTPLSIVIAAIMSAVFLGDSLYFGSVIGSIIISVGFYICLWGKVKEESVEDSSNGSLESGSTDNVPLLH